MDIPKELKSVPAADLDLLSAAQGELYHREVRGGKYACHDCGSELYSSADKFVARNKWPAFRAALPGAVKTEEDYSFGLKRLKVVCAKCGLSLGHIFHDGKSAGDLSPYAKDRHCIGSIFLVFTPDPSLPQSQPQIEATPKKASDTLAPSKPSPVGSAELVEATNEFVMDEKWKTAPRTASPSSPWLRVLAWTGGTVVIGLSAFYLYKWLSSDSSPASSSSPTSAAKSSAGIKPQTSL